MNEPAGFLGDDFTNVLKQYYTDTYNIIRKTVGNDMGVMLSDGFRGLDVSTPTNIRFQTHDSIYPTVLERYLQCSPIPRNVNGYRMEAIFTVLEPLLTVAPTAHVPDLQQQRALPLLRPTHPVRVHPGPIVCRLPEFRHLDSLRRMVQRPDRLREMAQRARRWCSVGGEMGDHLGPTILRQLYWLHRRFFHVLEGL